MKKLIYNENTKLIDIIECKEISESKNEEEKAKNQGRIKRPFLYGVRGYAT